MEGMILNRLAFELSVVTAKVFLNRFLKAAKAGECDSTTQMLCQYLCELTLQEYSFLKYRPSEIAAASLRLALHTMRLPAWTPLLESASGYTAEQLNNCVGELLAVFRKAEHNNLQVLLASPRRALALPGPHPSPGPHSRPVAPQAVREKYSHARFLCVSMLTPPDNAP